jgi:cell division septation protein DedD
LVGALLGLALLGSGFIYAYNETVSRDAQGEPPTLRADTRPVKVAPERPGGEQIENQNALVYDRVTGEPRQSTERLVSREEQVVDIPKGQPKDDSRPLAGSSANPPPLRPQPLTLASGQQAGASAPQAAGAEPAQGDGIAPLPKRVRTVLVRPDGSIAEAPPAAATAPGAPSASVPVPPQRPGNAPQPAASQAAPVAPAQAQPPVQRVTPGGSVGTVAVQPVRPVQPAAGNAPIRLTPQPAAPAHDNGQPQPLGQPQQLASAQPSAIAPQQPLVAPGQGGDFVVQLAARRSETQARATFDELRQRYSQLGRYRPLIQEADLGDRGVYYRVRVGPMSSQSEASQLCDSLKSSGLSDCLVRPR